LAAHGCGLHPCCCKKRLAALRAAELGAGGFSAVARSSAVSLGERWTQELSSGTSRRGTAGLSHAGTVASPFSTLHLLSTSILPCPNHGSIAVPVEQPGRFPVRGWSCARSGARRRWPAFFEPEPCTTRDTSARSASERTTQARNVSPDTDKPQATTYKGARSPAPAFWARVVPSLALRANGPSLALRACPRGGRPPGLPEARIVSNRT
jgi:hypothetical protein